MGGKSVGNTPSTPYLDTFNKAIECEKDKGDIKKNCAPKPESQKKR